MWGREGAIKAQAQIRAAAKLLENTDSVTYVRYIEGNEILVIRPTLSFVMDFPGQIRY